MRDLVNRRWPVALFCLAALVAVLAPSAAQAALPPQSTQPVEAGKVLWGMGDNIAGAESKSMFTDPDSPQKMVTTWYNGTGDLGWISGYTGCCTMSNYAKKGYAQHLVVWLADSPAYAVSPQFLTDLATLTKAMKGDGPEYSPLYITLFSEFETYSTDPAYMTQLHDQYMKAVDVVHNTASQAYVSLGFGGYTWAGKTTADLAKWNDAIAKSDFASVQAMQACDNTNGPPAGTNEVIPNLRNSVAQLGSTGKPVMVSHFLTWGDGTCPITAFKKIRDDLLSPSSLASLTSKGLFAWDMMNGGGAPYMDASTAGTDYATTKSMMKAVQSTGIDLPNRATQPPPPPPATGASVSDTGFTYAGTWNAVPSPSEHWTSSNGATAKVNFTAGTGGTTFTLRGYTDVSNHTATVSIDGGAPVTVNENGATASNQAVWTSPTIPAGNHTATVTVTSPDFSIQGADISNGTFGGPGGGTTGSTTGLTGAYFANATLTGTAALTRVDPTVNFNWVGSPGTGVPADNFSTRWTGFVTPKYSQTYTFYTNSDDGVRLWVNGVQLVNNWTDHGAVENSGRIALTAGRKYSIKVEYYDRTQDAIAQLSWSSASQAKQIIPTTALAPQ